MINLGSSHVLDGTEPVFGFMFGSGWAVNAFSLETLKKWEAGGEPQGASRIGMGTGGSRYEYCIEYFFLTMADTQGQKSRTYTNLAPSLEALELSLVSVRCPHVSADAPIPIYTFTPSTALPQS